MSGKVSREDLIAIEALYSAKNVAAAVDLCLYADATALQALALGGYAVNGFVNVYARTITETDLQEIDSSGITISCVTPDRAEDFVRCSAEGLAVTGRPSILLEVLARVAAIRADTRLYFAIIDGQIAGSAVFL
jgi:hypothetical protein